MRVTTWNVNGLRAAIRKGFADVLDVARPDVLLLQEIRVRPDQLPEAWAAPAGWHVAWHPAERPGYAGTAVWSRTPVEIVGTGFGGPDPEGRVLRVRTAGIDVVSCYLPSGSAGPERQAHKDAWLVDFAPWMDALAVDGRPVILAGDLNIAHTERDIWAPKRNAESSGFMPHERAWLTERLAHGWTDSVRHVHGPVDGPYSWWSNFGKARALDRGWRIDYLLASAALSDRIAGAQVHKEGQVVSDHAPVSVDLD